MFKRLSAINEVSSIVKSQIISAVEEATEAQRETLEFGNKWHSTFVLGYVTGLISICFQNRGIDGFVPGTAVQKVARKIQGRDMEIAFAGLIGRMDTEKAQREYEHGQNAAAVESLSDMPSVLKKYLLDYFDFDKEGNVKHNRGAE